MSATTTAVPRLQARDVTVRWGDVVAVARVDLTVETGEVVALLGPSGCGKSSLLAAIAGLVPHGGEVRIDDVDVSRARPDQRDLGLMFQDGALFPHLDVAANVAFGLRMHGWERRAQDERVEQVLDLVGLSGLGGRRIEALSGGQAQRVALARAIAPQPRLLLLDEPLTSLDARLRDRLLDELPDVFAAVDAAVVHVTHDQDEAMALADRVAVMRAGRIMRVDAPAALWADPGSAFVASFLGWSNIFPADATVGGQGGPRLVPDRVLADRGDPTLVGVDPGRVVVRAAGSGTAEDDAAWPGRVVRHRVATDHATVDVRLAADLVVRATGPTHALPGRDADVMVTIPADAWRGLAPDPTDAAALD